MRFARTPTPLGHPDQGDRRQVRRHHRHLSKAVLVGLLLSAVVVTVVSLPALASPTITTVRSAETAAPPANSRVTGTADCGSANNVVTGGGIQILTSADGTMAGDAQRVEGTGPGTVSGSFSSNNDTNARYWEGVDGTGTNNSDPNGGAYAYGLCDNTKTFTATTTVVTASVNHPTSNTDFTPAKVSCPAGTQLLSGGGYTTPQDGDLKLIASYPSDSNGNPASGTSTNPTYWSAIGAENGTNSDTTQVFAVCSSNSFTNSVKQAASSGITTTRTHQAVNVQCPSGSSLIGGGFSVDGQSGTYGGTAPFTSSGSPGDHAVGTYPTDSSGNAWTSGTSTGWTGVGHTGGMLPVGTTYVHTWAMCAS